MENKYTMRNLKMKDIYSAVKILKKIDLDFKEIADQLTKQGLKQSEAGMAVVKIIIDNLDKAQDEVNEFLGDLIGLTGEEFAELDFEDGLAVMTQFKNLKGLEGFFKSVAKQAGKK